MINKYNLDFVTNPLTREIADELNRIGLYFRIFSRVKTFESCQRKIKEKNYRETGALLQDLIGIRINLYFPDDLELVINLLKTRFEVNNLEVDKHENDTFKPSRINLVFNLQANLKKELGNLSNELECLDNTFEVQIRTVLSEGWHEVEHDLRYKCKSEWDKHNDLSRIMNGLYASIETTEWSMLTLIDRLTYRHYKNNDFLPMLRNKLRIRIQPLVPDEELLRLINKPIAKKILRINRSKFIEAISISKLRLPLNFGNLIHIINFMYIHDDNITTLQDEFLKNELNSLVI